MYLIISFKIFWLKIKIKIFNFWYFSKKNKSMRSLGIIQNKKMFRYQKPMNILGSTKFYQFKFFPSKLLVGAVQNYIIIFGVLGSQLPLCIHHHIYETTYSISVSSSSFLNQNCTVLDTWLLIFEHNVLIFQYP